MVAVLWGQELCCIPQLLCHTMEDQRGRGLWALFLISSNAFFPFMLPSIPLFLSLCMLWSYMLSDVTVLSGFPIICFDRSQPHPLRESLKQNSLFSCFSSFYSPTSLFPCLVLFVYAHSLPSETSFSSLYADCTFPIQICPHLQVSFFDWSGGWRGSRPCGELLHGPSARASGRDYPQPGGLIHEHRLQKHPRPDAQDYHAPGHQQCLCPLHLTLT